MFIRLATEVCSQCDARVVIYIRSTTVERLGTNNGKKKKCYECKLLKIAKIMKASLSL